MLGILFISFFIMMLVVGLLQQSLAIFIKDERNLFLISSLAQSLLTFMFPAFLTSYLCKPNPWKYMGFTNNVNLKEFIGVILVLLIATPAMNVIIDWNANINLPSQMSSFENLLREWENNASKITAMVLGDSTVWGLISAILIVGCVTGLAEELFFRAGLQKALITNGFNYHLAVWLTAFIFSAVHFQFFGFVPRLIIGAALGYLYYFSRSIWVAAFAHAMNNTSVVVFTWMASRGVLTIDVDKIGTTVDGSLTFGIISFIFTVILIRYFGRELFYYKDNE